MGQPEYSDLERAVGVRDGFFKDLVKEDDWSFVIKLHALFEAACSHLLLFHLAEPELAGIISRLELSNKTTGKLAFLSALKLVGKRSRRYISALSELRNDLVHDVRHAEFQLGDWFAALERDKQRTVAVSFSPFETFIREGPRFPGYEPTAQAEKQAAMDNVLRRAAEQTKSHIWLGAHDVLTDLLDMKGYSEYRQWAKAEAVLNDPENDAG